jgi:hypothetical protein
MADKDIKFNLTAVDKASEKIKGVNNEIDELGNNTKQQSQNMQMRWTELWSKVQLGVMAFQQVYRAAEQFYQLAREGAELEYTASKFDRLTESINTTTEALMVDLKEATDGTMSEMALMASATDFMTLGLAKSHDEVVRLTTVSSQLGMDMNQLVLTLTNQTTMRFDALGVAVDGFDEKVKALKDSGMDANEAFTEAFLQQAEEQIAKVGSVTDESIGSFMRLEAAWQDIVAEGKKNLVPVVADIAEGFATLLTRIPDNEDALYKLNQELMNGKITHDEYKTAVDNMLDSLHISIDEHGNLEAEMRGAEDATAALSDKTGLYSEAAYYAALQTQLWKADSEAITTAFGEQNEALIQLEDITLDATLAMKNYTEALLFSIASQGLNADQAMILAEAMGLVDEKTVYATEKTNIYRQMLRDGKIDVETYSSLIATLGSTLDGLPKDVNIDIWLETHGYDDFQRVANSIGSGGGSSQFGGAGQTNPIAQAAGGDIRPGGSAIVGEHGIEHLRVGYDGTVTVTPVTNNYNNYNLGVTTMQNLDTVTTGFAILQAMQ